MVTAARAARRGRLRASGHLRIVPRESDYAVYHSVLGRLCLVDDATVDLLRYLEAPRSRAELARHRPGLGRERIDRFLEFFRTRRFVVEADGDDGEILAERRRQRELDLEVGRQIRIVQLVLANRCNFRCKYCFEGLGGTPLNETIYAFSTTERLRAQSSSDNSLMRPEQAVAYLEEAIRLVRDAANRHLAVQFFGGEPMVNWRTIRHVLDHFGHGEGHGVVIDYSIITNGSLITEEVAEAFRRFGVPVVVSYDSPKGDARPLPSGKNSHEVVRRGLEMLRRYGNRVVLNSALAESTFDLFDRDLVDFAFDHGIWEIGVVLDLDTGFYERRSAAEIVDKLWDVCTYGRSKGVLVTGYWHQIFLGLAGDDRYGQIGFKNCSAMGVQLSIEPSGEVFSCKASGGYFGSILEREELLRSETYREYALRACTSPEPCQKCPVEHFCGGMCLGPVENKHHHDIYAVVEEACDVYREVTRRFILGATPRQVASFSIR